MARYQENGFTVMGIDTLKPLEIGHYDLCNISILGFDPITGRTFSECQAEWRCWLDEATIRQAQLKWWQFVDRLVLARIFAILVQRQGMII